MIKEIFHDSFDKCKICKGLSAEKQCKCDWVAKVVSLILIGGRLNY